MKTIDIHPNPSENIFLIGMMGSWKSTVGRSLAKRLDRKFVDLDDFLEKELGLGIAEIFETYGEVHFRDHEARLLGQITKHKGQVVSTGGGIILKQDNRELLQKNGVTILLKADPQTLAGRIRNTSRRPLLNSNIDLVSQLRQLWSERKSYYTATAHYQVETDTLTPSQVSSNIVNHLQERYADFAS